MTLHSQTGLTVIILDSFALGGRWLMNIDNGLLSWSHTVAADGGYKTASMTFTDSQPALESFLEFGLGRQVILYDGHTFPRWSGFVNSITMTLGGLSYQHGPLLDIANYCRIVYSTVDTSTTPPTMGVRKALPWISDADSIAKYGRIEKALSSGGSTDAEASQMLNMYLEEYRLPRSSQAINPSAGNVPSMTLELLGDVTWFETYVYNTTATGATNALTRLQAIMVASPTITFSTDYTDMDANSTSVPAWENDDQSAWEIMKGIIALGDPVDYTRFTFGIYNDKKAYYKKIPTDIEYVYRISSGSQVIETLGGAVVDPWAVLPARWIFVPDIMIGRNMITDLRDDPRNVFIESVSYTAPYGLTITGGRISKLSQAMAQKGLSGIGG